MDDVGTRVRRWRRHHAATICRMPAADGRCCGQGRRGQGIAGLWGRGRRKAAWQPQIKYIAEVGGALLVLLIGTLSARRQQSKGA